MSEDSVYMNFDASVCAISPVQWLETFSDKDLFELAKHESGFMALRHYKTGKLYVLRGSEAKHD